MAVVNGLSTKKSGESSWPVVSRRLARMVKVMRESIPSEARSVYPKIFSIGTPISSAIVARMVSIMSSPAAVDAGVAGLL